MITGHMTMMVYVNLILNYDHWSHDYDGICQSDFKLLSLVTYDYDGICQSDFKL